MPKSARVDGQVIGVRQDLGGRWSVLDSLAVGWSAVAGLAGGWRVAGLAGGWLASGGRRAGGWPGRRDLWAVAGAVRHLPCGGRLTPDRERASQMARRSRTKPGGGRPESAELARIAGCPRDPLAEWICRRSDSTVSCAGWARCDRPRLADRCGMYLSPLGTVLSSCPRGAADAIGLGCPTGRPNREHPGQRCGTRVAGCRRRSTDEPCGSPCLCSALRCLAQAQDPAQALRARPSAVIRLIRNLGHSDLTIRQVDD